MQVSSGTAAAARSHTTTPISLRTGMPAMLGVLWLPERAKLHMGTHSTKSDWSA